MTYSELLNEYKNQKNVSNNELAKLSGISSVYLGEILNGKKKPPKNDIQIRIVSILELDNDEKKLLFDLASQERNEIPADIDSYLRKSPELVCKIRKMEIEKNMIYESDIQPIQSNVKAKSHTAQYRMHKYFARRPYNVFRNLIDHYTNENDLILDCFLGGGVTVFEAAAMKRKVVGVDINPLSSFITKQQMFNGDLVFAKKYLEAFVEKMYHKYKCFYEIQVNEEIAYAIWTELSYTVECPECLSEMVLSEENKIRNGFYSCPNSDCIKHNGVKRTECKPLSSRILRVKYVDSKGETKLSEANKVTFLFDDIQIEKKIKDITFKPDFLIPDDWDRQHEDKLRDKGFEKYSDLYTKKNYALNCLIYDEIIQLKDNLPKEIYELVYFLFSSSLRYTNNMTRVTANWEGGNPTSMDKHAFWFPNQYVETNILEVLKKRCVAIIKGITYSKNNLQYNTHEVLSSAELLAEEGSYMILNRSSTKLPFDDETFDVVITDPPYGSNVQYAELSVVWNAWFQNFANLDNFIYNKEEAVMNRKISNLANPKTELNYEALLYEVFREANRVLKNNHYLVFTFNNKNIKVWIAMLNAVAKAGFYLPDNGIIFQDFIESYKNTSHLKYSGNIHGDFIYSFIKGKHTTKSIRFQKDQNIMSVIELSILAGIEKLFNVKKEYSTTDLYQHIFTDIVITIMDYIHQFGTIQDISEIKDVSDEAIDNILKKELDYVGSMWIKKEKFDGVL